MTLMGAVGVIADGLATVEGVATSTSTPPEQMSPDDFPAVAVYLGKGSARAFTASNDNGYPTFIVPSSIVVDLHFDRREDDLGATLLKASNMVIPILIRLFKMYLSKFNDNISSMGDLGSSNRYPITFDFAHLNWGSIETLGYRIKIDVSTEEEIK